MLIQFFAKWFDLPTAVMYVSTRMILSAVTTLAFTIFLGPFFIKKLYALKIGQSIRGKDIAPLLASLHKDKKDTPTMGGLLLILGMLLSLVLWMDWSHLFTWIMLITTLWLGFVGILDDYFKIKYKSSDGICRWWKFVLQMGFAVLLSVFLLSPSMHAQFFKKPLLTTPVAKEEITTTHVMHRLSLENYSSRLYIPFMKKPIELGTIAGKIFIFFLMVVVIVGSSNAVNLTDGLDGLAAGLLVLVSSVFALIAFLSNHIDISRYLNILYIDGSSEIAVYLFALTGSCLGFLWYNSYPAQLFMGDTGSLALGGILGVSCILLKKEILLAIVGAIFVFEALSVIIQVFSYRYRNKKRVFLCTPVHHHFEYKGWAEPKVVMRFWIVGLLFAILGIASIKFQF